MVPGRGDGRLNGSLATAISVRVSGCVQARGVAYEPMSYLQAIVIALVQGVTELFPVSSLGHSVLVPAWIGGSWQTLVTQSSQATSETSFYLAFIVALHCATALALLWFFRADWVRIIGGFIRSVRRSVSARRVLATDADERLAWLIVLATIPVGITGPPPEAGF